MTQVLPYDVWADKKARHAFHVVTQVVYEGPPRIKSITNEDARRKLLRCAVFFMSDAARTEQVLEKVAGLTLVFESE